MTMSQSELQTAGGAAQSTPLDITFDNRGDTLLGLAAWNGLLKVLTLGLYGAWARSEVRRRIWSFVRLNGEPIVYTGTGLELFLGLLIAVAVLVLPATLGGLAVATTFSRDSGALAAYQVALYVVFFLLIGNAIYRAWRYRLSRSLWRGIRGALVGSAGYYGWMYFWTLAVPLCLIALAAGIAAWITGPEVGGVILVLGLATALWVLPWRANKLRAQLTNDARFGDRPLHYDGRSGPLYKAYVTAWIGCTLLLVAALAASVVVLARAGVAMPEPGHQVAMPPAEVIAPLAGIWLLALVLAAVLTASYRASQIRHFARHTHFEGAVFSSSVTGPGLLWITLSNWVLKLAAIAAAVVIAGALTYALGLVPELEAETAPSQTFDAATAVRGALVIAVLVVPTTIASTIAQLRSARYLMSRLKLHGAVDVAAIMQSQSAAPRRGEGLAQVFDLDAI